MLIPRGFGERCWCDGGTELQASKAATYYAAMAALTSEALQVHGGIGFTWEHDLHLYHRRVKANQVLFGDPYLHHERLAAALETATA